MKVTLMKSAFSILFFFAICSNLMGQTVTDKNNLFSVTDAQIKEYVEEVYAHEADMVFNSPQRIKDIKDLLKNRIVVIRMNDGLKQKSLIDFSSVQLLDYNNPNLKKESNFNPKNFNPLKYDFDFYPRGKVAYLVADSHVIIISPQKN